MNQEPLKIHYIKFGAAKPKPVIAPELLDPEGSLAKACAMARLSIKEARGPSRIRLYAYKRFDVMRTLWDWGFNTPQIGQLLGGRDHSTICAGLKRWDELHAGRFDAAA